MGHIRITLILLLVCFSAHAQQSTATSSGGGGTGIAQSAGVGTNTTIYGQTNYYSSDSAGNTNGPRALYRINGSNGYTNLIEDILLGNASGTAVNARWAMQWSKAAGDGSIGGIFINTDHDGVPPDWNKSEMQLYSGGHFAFGPGYGNNGKGHIQLGIGQLGAYGAGNYYSYGQQAVALSQSSPTGFSFANFFRTTELQGAVATDHFPGFVAYSIRTNAPGRWALMFTTDAGFTANDTWDPNTMKAGRRLEFVGGDTNLTRVFGPISFTNLTVNSSNALVLDDTTLTANMNFDFNANGNFNVGGNGNLSYLKSSKLLIVNNSGDGTAFTVKDNSGNFSVLLDPANGTANGGSWISGQNLAVGVKSVAAAQALDVYGSIGVTNSVIQTNMAGFLASDATSVNTTFANLTLSFTTRVLTSHRYRFTLTLFLDDSTAADGAKVDFNGGTATMTAFRVGASLFTDLGGTTNLTAGTSTTLAGVINQGTMANANQHKLVVDGSIEPSAAGTFIARFAQNAHSTGTLTVRRGSNLVITDMP